MTDAVVTVERLEAWVRAFAASINQHAAQLTELDSAIGDGDHGINMDRGMRAVVDKLDSTRPSTAEELFKLVGLTLVSSVGGASGPLYGTFFLRLGVAAGPNAALSAGELARGLRAGLDGIAARGKAELGDKTMFDALSPAIDALDAAIAAGSDVGEAFAKSAAACAAGRDATIPLVARKGRASYLGERSAGHLDPGATSATLLLDAAAATLSS